MRRATFRRRIGPADRAVKARAESMVSEQGTDSLTKATTAGGPARGMIQDLYNLTDILKRLSGVLGPQGAALRLNQESFDDDGAPMLKVQARLSGRPSEADLVGILEAGRRIVREIGTDAMFWTELSGSNLVDFCFAAPSRKCPENNLTTRARGESAMAAAQPLFGGLSTPAAVEDRSPDPESGLSRAVPSQR